uniref:Uncharacterized protein n=1 Tax=Romanomermis culicivorax TaxID=13658 RepID=A0A915L7H2_ROMCU
MSSDGGSPNLGSVLNSAYYRERFGSRSPEEYKSLRITNIDPKIEERDLDDVMKRIFSRYGDMHCKVVRPSDVYERIAYVNYEYPEDARDARNKAGPRIMRLLGRKVRVDPANVVRDQMGKVLRRNPPPPGAFDPYRRSASPAYNAAPQDNRNTRRSDNYESRARSPNRGPANNRNDISQHLGGQQHPRPTWEYREGNDAEDSFANRTLFVGNLEIDITINELRRCFERFGTVEEIDIKTPQDAVTAYAFVRFSDILSAREARKHCSGEYLRDNRCKIGWGKPIVTRRLWVGGLGPDASMAWLEKEFDRYGAIEKIDFVRGDNHAYVLYANQEASIEAWKKLRGLRMRNGVLENLIQVDFADASISPVDRYKRDGSSQRRRRSPSSSPPPKRRHSGDYSPASDRSRRSSEGSSRRRDKNGSNRRSAPSRQTGLAAAAEFAADSFEELSETRTPVWTGALILKKGAYFMNLYKMAGDEDLIDAYLRNDRGASVELNIQQRLKLDQPRSGEILRVSAAAMRHSAYLLAVPNVNAPKMSNLNTKPLKLLVQYFVEKNAAGVVNTCLSSSLSDDPSKAKLPANGVLYAFPHCTLSDDFVATLCPQLTVWQRCKDDCLLLVVQKGSPTAAPAGQAAQT